ncbi:MAG: hypothetical protein HQL35_14465, partial [Alphaproteobacteria bacterium]|nr:hypothetical protein [Alphaproteobacteria bacterium]
LLLVWAGASFAVFSVISGKQPHYLLPIFPALALLAALMLTRGDEAGTSHRAPLGLLAGLSAVILAAGLGLETIEPLLKKPLPDWAGAVQPLWMIPALVLTIAAVMSRAAGALAQTRLIAVSAATVIVFLHMAAEPAFRMAYDLEPTALEVKAWQTQGRPVAYIGKYHAEFQFLGRLNAPVDVIDDMGLAADWARAHPDGILIATLGAGEIPVSARPLAVRPYRGKVMATWEATAFPP